MVSMVTGNMLSVENRASVVYMILESLSEGFIKTAIACVDNIFLSFFSTMELVAAANFRNKSDEKEEKWAKKAHSSIMIAGEEVSSALKVDCEAFAAEFLADLTIRYVTSLSVCNLTMQYLHGKFAVGDNAFSEDFAMITYRGRVFRDVLSYLSLNTTKDNQMLSAERNRCSDNGIMKQSWNAFLRLAFFLGPHDKVTEFVNIYTTTSNSKKGLSDAFELFPSAQIREEFMPILLTHGYGSEMSMMGANDGLLQGPDTDVRIRSKDIAEWSASAKKDDDDDNDDDNDDDDDDDDEEDEVEAGEEGEEEVGGEEGDDDEDGNEGDDDDEADDGEGDDGDEDEGEGEDEDGGDDGDGDEDGEDEDEDDEDNEDEESPEPPKKRKK